MAEYDIAGAFGRIEDELISSMIRNLTRHKAEEGEMGFNWTQWQAEQLKALAKYKRHNRKKYGTRFEDLNHRIEEAIREMAKKGGADAEKEILEGIKKGFIPSGSGRQGAFFHTNERKLDALIKATTDDMKKAEVAILRMADDRYRRIIFDAQAYAATGAGTYEKAVDMATKDMAMSGLNCVEYKNGARHRLEDYASMAIRTANKRAYLYGEGERRQAWGVTTVIVNKRTGACPKCLPFCGKVFIDDVWSGGEAKDGDYPLLSSAVEAGLYHPNCKDSHTTYFPGISTMEPKWTKAEILRIAKNEHRAAERQNLQRMAERWDRVAKTRLDPENEREAKNRAETWKIQLQFNRNVDETNDGLIQYSLDKNGTEGYPKIIESRVQTGGLEVGGHHYSAIDHSKESVKAAEAYEKYSRGNDAEAISRASGFTVDEVNEIRRHIFYDKHNLYEGYARFAPDYNMAVAWKRLREGNPKPRDITLLHHELLESRLEKQYNLPLADIHAMANEKYNWYKQLFDETGGKEEEYDLL